MGSNKKKIRSFKTGQQIARESIKRHGTSNASMSDHNFVASKMNPRKKKYFYKELNKHWKIKL